MKTTIITLCLAVCFTSMYAQVKVGNNPTVINSNAVLDVEATDKGILLPRVALVTTGNAAPLTAHVSGMFVYNTATANDVVPGIYYNDGTRWVQSKFSTCQGFGSRFTGGSQSHPGDGTFVKVIFSSEDWDQGNVFAPGAGASTFTVTESGKYILTANVFTQNVATLTNRALSFFRNGAHYIQGDNTTVAAGSGYGLKVSYIADLVAGDVIDLRLHVNNAPGVNILSANFTAIKADCGSGMDVDTEPWRNASDNLGATNTSTNIYYTGGNVGTSTVKAGNNPNTIADGSLLELESTNKGLRMPQIALTNTTTWAPLLGSGGAATSPGMSVYNTNAGITSSNVNYPANGIGEYYWDGTGWVNKNTSVTQSSLVLFSAKRTATQNAVDGSYVVCDFTAEDYDKNNNFNLTTNSFTVPTNAAGFYQINGFFSTTVQGGNQGGYLSLFVDGVFRRFITIGNANAGAGIVASGTIAVQLAAGDVVTIRYQANTASQEFNPHVDIYQISR